MVSLIKMFVLCLFDKYLFETCESVTEFCWNPVFQMRPLTQLLSLLSESASGQITQVNMGSVTSSAMKASASCSTIESSLSYWLMESEYFYTVSIMIFSHMYTTDQSYVFSKYVSDTKWTYCTLLSNSQIKQIILVYYCSNTVWSNWNHNFFLMWIWFVINFEFLAGSWLFLLHLSYHWVTEEFYSCNKQLLFVFCEGNSLNRSTCCVGFIISEIRELISTHNFIQATHKKYSRCVNITSHSEWKFLLSVIFLKN